MTFPVKAKHVIGWLFLVIISGFCCWMGFAGLVGGEVAIPRVGGLVPQDGRPVAFVVSVSLWLFLGLVGLIGFGLYLPIRLWLLHPDMNPQYVEQRTSPRKNDHVSIGLSDRLFTAIARQLLGFQVFFAVYIIPSLIPVAWSQYGGPMEVIGMATAALIFGFGLYRANRLQNSIVLLKNGDGATHKFLRFLGEAFVVFLVVILADSLLDSWLNH